MLRMTPRSDVPEPVDLAAQARLAAFLRGELAQAEVEAPSYDELEAYVDGQLDPADAEAFATRLEDDPLLAAEVADLERLRELLARRRGAGAAPPSRAVPRWFWAAAATLAVAVAGTVVERSLAPHRPVASPQMAAVESEGSAETIFGDGFESGGIDAWQSP